MVSRIGKADCGECGGKGTVHLAITHKGIWSYCEKCGYAEWEWTLGDNPKYLGYLARRFGVPVDELVKLVESVVLAEVAMR